MEPVTHVLTGVCLARAGLNRCAAYATAAMAIAAELPDIDTLWRVRGPVAAFAHHRGITHTFAGLPVEAAVVVLGVYGLHRWRLRGTPALQTAVPARWGCLYLLALIALLSHLFLDWTNNYGVRPLFPFDGRWHAGSFVFIFDPVLFALLLLPIAMPPLFRLVGSEMGERRRTPFTSRGWSVAALVLMSAYWSFRAVEHGRAMDVAAGTTVRELPADRPAAGVDAAAGTDAAVAPAPPLLPLQTAHLVEASPDMLNPWRWYMALGFDRSVRLATVNSASGELTWTGQVYADPPRSPVLVAAMHSRLGQVYLDWSPMPVLTVAAPQAADPGVSADAAPPSTRSIVRFRDPRFLGDQPLLSSRGQPPLSGEVDFDATNRVVQQSFGGAIQR